MKLNFTQTFLAIIALASSLSLSAQDKKILSITVAPEDTGKELTIELGVTVAQDFKVDWGSKTLSEPIQFSETETKSVTGTIAGSEIIVYGTNPARIKNLTQRGGEVKIKSIDISAMTGLKVINIEGTDITTLDASACTSLTLLQAPKNALNKLVLPATETLTEIEVNNEIKKNEGIIISGTNAVLGTDWSIVPNLKKLVIDGNALGADETFDISKNAELDELDINCCHLKSLDISNNLKFRRLLAYHNDFTDFDASTMIANATVQVSYNKLTSIKLPAETMNTLHIEGNFMTFANLPAKPTKLASLYKYANQSPLETTVVNGKVDLSSQLMVGETPTIFSWKNEETDLVEGTDYTVANGVFTFLKDAEKAVCTMTNTALSKLTLKTVELNIKSAGIESIDADDNAPVEYYDLRGIKANGDTPGIYIRRQGNKTTKIIVK